MAGNVVARFSGFGRELVRLSDLSDLLSTIGSASTTAQGVVELATDAETITGTDTARAVTPAGGAAAYQGLKTLLTNIGNLSMVADRYIYGTGTNTVALGTITSDARSLLADADVPRISTANDWDTNQQVGAFSTSGATLGVIIRPTVPGLILSSVQGSATARHWGIYNLNGLVGTVTTNGSATAYNTSSDRRLKDIVGDADVTGSLARIMAIKIRDYTWKADGEAGYGVIADELAEVVPHAVTGERDAIDEQWLVDGKEQHLTTTKARRALDQLADAEDAHKLSETVSPQGVDYSKLVPDLIGAMQSMMAEIAALKDEVATLKSARIK